MRILIAGDREWTNAKAIRQIIDGLVKQHGQFTLIHGAGRGVDSLAAHIAKYSYQLPIMEFPANWERHGKAAGPIRNRQMLAEGRPDLVVVIHNNLAESKGTGDMFYISGIAKVPRVWYSEKGGEVIKEYDERV